MEAETALAGDEADAADFGAGRAGRSELAAVVGMASVLFKRLSNLKATRVPWASIAIVHRFIRLRAWGPLTELFYFLVLYEVSGPPGFHLASCSPAVVLRDTKYLLFWRGAQL